MTASRIPFYSLIGLLIISGVSLAWYRHIAFDVPWLPGEKRHIWSVEAKVEFLAEGKSVLASLAIPDSQFNFERMGEHTASPGYGLSYVDDDKGRRAEWSVRSADGKQILYYRVDMLVDEGRTKDLGNSIPKVGARIKVDGPYTTSARNLLANAKNRSADEFTLARELILAFNTQTQSAQFLAQKQRRSLWLVDLLSELEVPSREVQGLVLEDGRRRQSLKSFIQVYSGQESRLFDPISGRRVTAKNILLWEYHSAPLLDLVGATQSSVSFSMIEQDVPAGNVQQHAVPERALLDFSIHSLPLGEQALFKGILLIPVGVLVVVFLRIFVGFRTSGTFMPVLIAMAFIQTSLITGLVGFILIVSIGLMIRSYLSRLNLLLVARISVVIVSVIVLIAVFSVIAFQLGLSEGLKITFFPMIILSWTIERMSILWEEEGPQEVFVQVGGSLLVALLAYALMTNEFVRHLTFNFMGLQLIIMALLLWMGSYAGYRLLEFRRFRPLLSADHRN